MPSYLAEPAFYIALLAAGIRIAAPLIYAAVGELFAERAGVLNVGLEGTMLIGTWAAFMGMFFSGSGLIGVLCAIAGGMLITAALGYVCINRGANQIIAGIVVNIFALGFTSLTYRHIFRSDIPSVESFLPIRVPLLSDLPLIGNVLFNHTILVYLAFALVPLASFILYRTQLGLCLRAAGELPAAVDTAGVNVLAIRYAGVLLCGAFAGLGGAALSIGQLEQFNDNLTAGRGFIALAIVLLGRWDPWKVAFGSILFGIADALQLRLQVLNFAVPKELLAIIPYVLAIAAMALFVKHIRLPAAFARPYGRE
ncbi:MAG TPA: ABC transporter permease [Xanthobacteraceae bacterium]|jgi:simple sugar transport system permease protein